MHDMIRGLLIFFCLATALFAQSAPRVTVTPIQVAETDPIEIQGSGFTPKGRVISHLRRPDGTEYDVMWFVTNDRGEFSHIIDTLLLAPGTHELWVIDEASRTTSNTALLAVDFQVDVPSPPEVQQIIARYIGVWRGNGSRSSRGESSLLISLTGGNSGTVAGMIAYPALACGGVLTFRRIYADSIEFLQTSSYGVERCGEGGEIRLKLEVDGSVNVSGAATGKVVRLKD